MPCDYTRYPKDWPEIRKRILARAKNRCERCGAHHHAVGYWDEEGRWMANCGNLHCDASGLGQHPSGEPLTYREAREFVEHYNDSYVDGSKRLTDFDGNRWVVIVLTIAHVENPDPMDCRDENLQALCQRCHNRLDQPMRQANARKTRMSRRAAGELPGLECIA